MKTTEKTNRISAADLTNVRHLLNLEKTYDSQEKDRRGRFQGYKMPMRSGSRRGRTARAGAFSVTISSRYARRREAWSRSFPEAE